MNLGCQIIRQFPLEHDICTSWCLFYSLKITFETHLFASLLFNRVDLVGPIPEVFFLKNKTFSDRRSYIAQNYTVVLGLSYRRQFNYSCVQVYAEDVFRLGAGGLTFCFCHPTHAAATMGPLLKLLPLSLTQLFLCLQDTTVSLGWNFISTLSPVQFTSACFIFPVKIERFLGIGLFSYHTYYYFPLWLTSIHNKNYVNQKCKFTCPNW